MKTILFYASDSLLPLLSRIWRLNHLILPTIAVNISLLQDILVKRIVKWKKQSQHAFWNLSIDVSSICALNITRKGADSELTDQNTKGKKSLWITFFSISIWCIFFIICFLIFKLSRPCLRQVMVFLFDKFCQYVSVIKYFYGIYTKNIGVCNYYRQISNERKHKDCICTAFTAIMNRKFLQNMIPF